MVLPDGSLCGRNHRSVEPSTGLGMCAAHYTRTRKHGDPQAHIPIATRDGYLQQCSVTDDDGRCPNKVGKSGALGMCQKHWARTRVHGTPSHREEAVKRGAYKNYVGVRACEIEDEGVICGRESIVAIDDKGRMLCGKHYQRYYKWGDAEYLAMPHMTGASPRTFCEVPLTYKPGDPPCGRPSKVKGVCAAHDARMRAKGDYNTDRPVGLRGLSDTERMAVFSDPDEGYINHVECLMPTPCWIWKRAIGSHGYGMLGKAIGGEKEVHRAFFEYHLGSIPEGSVVHHMCGNRVCCNPEHLEAVTHQENVAEAHRNQLLQSRIEELEAQLRVVND